MIGELVQLTIAGPSASVTLTHLIQNYTLSPLVITVRFRSLGQQGSLAVARICRLRIGRTCRASAADSLAKVRTTFGGLTQEYVSRDGLSLGFVPALRWCAG